MKPRQYFLAQLFLACLSVWTLEAAQSPKGYYRMPALHGDTVVFTAEGDLWRVPATGGLAIRLTTHVGMEAEAAISPDGQMVAFSAEYEGPTEVYVIPLAGGLPTRLTFDGDGAQVIGWSPEGRILYSTFAFSTLPNAQLAIVDPKTGERRLLPLAQASQGVYDDAGRRLVFTRLAKQGSSTKRYRGGTAENLWRFADGDSEASPLTADYPGTSRDPMWWKDRVYFASDRDGVMNLWSMKPDGSDVRPHTRHRDHDVKSPCQEGGRIVYQHGPDLRLLDLASGRDELIDIRLASDFDQQRERWVKKPTEFLTAVHLSPTGDRLVLTARGQVFVAPVEQGRFVEVPRRTEVRYRDARFMPDGKSLLALTDESGELEFCHLPANGVGPARPLTTNGTVFRFSGLPSPDGKRVAFSDKDRKLWVHHVETRETTLIVESPRLQINDFAWSLDSQWLAFTDAASNNIQQIQIYHVTNRSLTTVTSDRVESFSPAWSPDGQWLYFLSDRELRSLVNSPWGARQPDPFFTETTKIYALALKKSARWPFRPKDELQPDSAEDKKDPDKDKDEEKEKDKDKDREKDQDKDTEKKRETDKEKKEEDEKKDSPDSPVDGAEGKAKERGAKGTVTPKPVVIELEGLGARLFEVPVPAGNYQSLEVTEKHLLWLARDLGFNAKTHLKQLEITRKEPKPKTLVEDLNRYELSANGKKLLIRKGETFHVINADATAPAKLEDKVNLDGWSFSLTPREEWRQIYTEAWRMMRDYFYDRGMHGVDWQAVRAKYRSLLDRVSDRAELSDVLSDMVGELSALHVFVALGESREVPDKIRVGSLGARWVRDAEAGGWRVEHVYRGDPDYPAELSPLAQPSVDVRQGDVITSINGRSTLGVTSPELLLRNQTGKQALLEIKPKDGGTNRLVIVRPVSSNRALDLRYDEWELSRREMVERLGRGEIGYVHLRAMGAEDIAQWARNFFPVFNRQGLVIDVRHNSGGNIDSWILGKLLRKAWFYWQPRVGDPVWNMQYAFRGHLVVLCNERTASDGEAFTEGFRRLGLGKVIGTRTWGGEIWLSAQRWLVDSGMATAAEIGVYGPEGEWLIEGHGVDPDMVVDNLPHETFNGRDAQLEAGVKHLQELIRKDPRPVPPAPKYPDKSFKPQLPTP